MLFFSSCAWFTSKPVKEESKVVEVKSTTPEIAPEVLVTAESHVSDGVTFYQNAEYNKAIDSWNQAVELIPGDAELHNFIGISYHKLNDLKQAEKQFTFATQLDSTYYEAFNNLGYVRFLQGEYDAANLAFQRALKINPNYDPAKTNYEKTKEIVSGKLNRQVFELTEQAEKLDDLDKKIEYYQTIIKLDPANAESHNNLAVAYFYADNLDSAYMHLNKALTLRKDYPEALNNLGYIYKLAVRYPEAINLFLKAISLKPRYSIALNNLGETYILNKEIENARRVFQTALAVDPQDVYARDNLNKLKGQ